MDATYNLAAAPELGLDEIKNLVLIHLTMVFNSGPVERRHRFWRRGGKRFSKVFSLRPNVWMVKMSYHSFARPLALLGFTMPIIGLFSVVPLL